jgi:hypothetical protein
LARASVIEHQIDVSAAKCSPTESSIARGDAPGARAGDSLGHDGVRPVTGSRRVQA